MKTRLAHDDLLEIVGALPALDLKGVALQQQYEETGELPPAAAYVEATQQMLAYTETCAETVRALRTLPAVPAGEPVLVEGFAL